MVQRLKCEVEQNLVFHIEYDDGTEKTKVISTGDYVWVAYNHNGCRKQVTGTVSGIHANPESTQSTRKDWYFIVHPDSDPVAVKIICVNVLDAEVLHMRKSVNPINTPNNAMRVTDIRIKAGYLQVSNNNGHSWKTVTGEPLSDIDIPEEAELHDKIHNIIGSDQYSTSDDLVNAIVDLIRDEARKLRHRCPESTDEGGHCHAGIFEEG